MAKSIQASSHRIPPAPENSTGEELGTESNDQNESRVLENPRVTALCPLPLFAVCVCLTRDDFHRQIMEIPEPQGVGLRAGFHTQSQLRELCCRGRAIEARNFDAVV